MNPHVAGLVARLQEQPSHTGSLIITLFGDALMPRGGAVALANILDVLAFLGIGPGVVRTAISRLSAEGWLVASRRSRASFYRIGPARQGEFVRASRHIYGPPRRAAARELILALPEPGDEREAMRERFTRLGFVAWQGMMLAPERPLPPSLAADSIVLTATGRTESLQKLASRAWRLDMLAEMYQGFIGEFASLTEVAGGVEPHDALLARLLLIHAYRRIILRDPRLPSVLLPDDWAGSAARHLCATLYAALIDASEAWLDENAQIATGKLPPADSTLRRRFADVKTAG